MVLELGVEFSDGSCTALDSQQDGVSIIQLRNELFAGLRLLEVERKKSVKSFGLIASQFDGDSELRILGQVADGRITTTLGFMNCSEIQAAKYTQEWDTAHPLTLH